MKSKVFVSLAVSAFGLAACAGSTVAEPVKSQPAGSSESAEALKAFPAVTRDQKRHVIHLPAQSDENSIKVELMVGKTMDVDCNHHRFTGQLEEKTAEGWGYTYYQLKDLGPGMSTLMGCPPNSGKKSFVTAGEQTLTRYNSRLPIVIYTPKDVEVRYRLWRAEAEQVAN